MAKFLDASGVKHFWGKITDWVNGLGISNDSIDKLTFSSPTNPDNVFDFPRISLERRSNDYTEWGLKIKNGYKYAQAGYVPILFCKMKHMTRGGRNRGKSYYQSEFMRHPRVFLTIGEADSLGMFWKLSRKDVDTFSGVNFLKCKDFFSNFQANHLYTNTDFANILCKIAYNTTTLLPVYVHTYKFCSLNRGGKFDSGRYNMQCIRSWKYEKRGNVFDDAYNVPAWMLRSMEFEFKIGFCPNYFSYRNPNENSYIKYDPAIQFQSDYFYYYNDYMHDYQFYDWYADAVNEFPIVINHRYKLSDCVSNVVTFKCVINAGDRGVTYPNDCFHAFRLVVY